MNGFHEIRFPVSVSFRSGGGPERRTEIVELASGFEERNSPWQHARRRYDAGLGIRSMDDVEQVLAFFEARYARLYGFRWKDFVDFRSAAAGNPVTALDQQLGIGDGVQDTFAVQKTYEEGSFAYRRPIRKLVQGTFLLAVDGVTKTEGVDFSVDINSGEVRFLPGSIPMAGEPVTCGYEFDVPVRFDTDALVISPEAFNSGSIGSIPIVEVR